MIDLVCLVADKCMEAALLGVHSRPQAIGIRPITAEILVHPRRDPGCFHEGAEFLRGFRGRAERAIILLDRAWEGAPATTGEKLESLLRARLRSTIDGQWGEPIVIDPELENWVFASSPHVDSALGWKDRTPPLRQALRERGLWPEGVPKPPDPRAAVDFALKAVRKPRSSSVYRHIAEKVSLRTCHDRAFGRFRSLLLEWFPQG